MMVSGDGDGHWHRDSWTRSEQHRYEDRVSDELNGLRQDLKEQGNRILLMMGGLGLLAFLLPLVAPFIRQAFGGFGP